MNNKNYFTIGVLVIAILTLGVIGYTVRKPVVNVQPVIEQTQELGAIPGSEVAGDYFTIGGIDKAYKTVQMSSAATTTKCWVKNPFNATSTIDKVTVRITKVNGGIGIFDLSTSTSPSASSTPALIYAHTVAANTLDSLVWMPLNTASTSVGTSQGTALPVLLSDLTDGRSVYFLKPNEYITYKVSSSSPGALWYGTCQFEFTKL